MEVSVIFEWYGGKGGGAITVPHTCSLYQFRDIASSKFKFDSEFSKAKVYLPTKAQVKAFDFDPTNLTPEEITRFRLWKRFEEVNLESNDVVIVFSPIDPVECSILTHETVGKFCHSDLALNKILAGAAHASIDAFWTKLEAPRSLPENMYQRLRQGLAAKGEQFLSLFDKMILSSLETETRHHTLESNVYATLIDSGAVREQLYNRHREAFTSELFMGYTRWSLAKADRYQVRHSTQPWPIFLLTKRVNNDDVLPYNPTSDFSLWTNQVPYLIHETYNSSPNKADSSIHLKMQGGAIIKFFSACFTDFVFPISYAHEDAMISLTLLHEEGGDVKMYTKMYDLSLDEQYLDLLVTFFNLMDRSENIPELAKKLLQDLVNKKSEHFSKGSFTGGPSNPSKKRKLNDDDKGGDKEAQQREQHKEVIESSGYIFLNSITGWPGLYNAQDPQGIIRVVKKIKVESHSEEMKIMQSLTRYTSCENVIRLISTINDEFIVLPCYTPLASALYVGGIHCDCLLPFSDDLCRGLIFLHSHKIAHLDIRPDNLVINSDNTLVIIDFSESLEDKDEVEGIYGTEGYRAPEINGGMFNPFQADTFSCGRTLEELSWNLGDFDGTRHHLMLKFMDLEPQERPPLGRWFTESFVGSGT